MSVFSIKEYSIPASGAKHINAVGKFFFIVEAESPVDVMVTRNNSIVGQGFGMDEGWSHGPRQDEFHGLQIASSDASSQTVKVAIGDDLNDYRRMIGAVDVTALPAIGTKLTALSDESVAATTAGKIVTANSATRQIHLYTDQALRLGDVDNKPSAAGGVYVPAGTLCVIDSSAEIWAYNTAASAANIYLSLVQQ